METIKNKSFEGERPLFSSHYLKLENVKIYPGVAAIPGESALKESSYIHAFECEFAGKYPFWHNNHTLIDQCVFKTGGRAAIWYSNDIKMLNSTVEAPKMFRDSSQLYIENTKFLDAAEFGWHCHDIKMHTVEIDNGDYLFMMSRDIEIENMQLNGNYPFQYTENIEIKNSKLNSKDAFWNSKNVTVYNSVLNGQYLGWHSDNLRLVNCTIIGSQALCYANNLVLKNCTMIDTDLSFEYSTVEANILGDIISIKNPASGFITADTIGDIIIDNNCPNPSACKISIRTKMAS